MFYSWLYPLKDFVSGFNIFRYITTRSAIAAFIAFVISLVFYPKLIRFLKKQMIGQVVRDDGPQSHLQKTGTPTMGGILIAISMIVALVFAGNFDNPYTIIFIIGIILFSTIGFIDDYLKFSKSNSKGLIPRYKMLMLICFSIIISFLFYFFTPSNEIDTLFSIYLPFVTKPLISIGLGYIVFSTLLLCGATNGVNLTDGLDGLAAGLVIIVGIAYAIFTYISGHMNVAEYLKVPYMIFTGEVTVIVSAMIGAVAGFLWFNSHPAEIFMGDTGSILLGGIIGMFSIVTKTEILLIIIGGVFVIETISVILQVFVYKTKGKRLFLMSPLHHHFELKGWAESKVIARFWIVGAILAVLALTTLKIR